jgi:cysteine desulfurase
MATPLYLDYAGSTPVDPQVAEAMLACLRAPALSGNAAALHWAGVIARERVETARRDVALLVNATPEEILWTSGATESNNLAILGAARFHAHKGRHLITAVSEHASVLECFRQLEREGFRVTRLRPDADGIIEPAALASALRPDTVLVSLMHVNNETGVIQDIDAFGALCRARGPLLHVDAAQSLGRQPVDVRAMHVDLLSLSAHKMAGPKGIGALFLDRERVRRIEPLLFGGGQEQGLRPGTVPTHQVVGMGVAAMLARERLATDPSRIRALRDELWWRVAAIPGVLLNGHPSKRACHILNVSVEGVEGESLLFALADLAVSSGSACASDTDEPSAVLHSLGRPDHLAQSSVRFSMGRETMLADIERAAATLRDTVMHLRSIAPAESLRLSACP